MKKLLLIPGFILVLALGAVLLLPKLVPMETIIAKAKEQVKAETGRDLNFSGMKFVFWPNIGVELKDVTFSNPAWAKEKNMLALDKMDVALAVRPLLQKRVEVKRFELAAPIIHLEIGAGGKQSWDFSKEKPAEAGQGGGPSVAAQTGGFDLKFGKFQISKGTLTFADWQKGSMTSISDVDVTATFPDLKSPLQLEGSLTYQGKRVDLSLDLVKPMALVQGDTSPGQVSVKTSDISVKAAGVLAMQGEMFNGDVESDVASLAKLLAWVGGGKEQKLPFEKVSFASAVRATKTDLVLKSADLTLDDVHAKGNLNIGFAGKPDIFARLSVGKLNLDRFTGAQAGSEEAGKAGDKKEEGWDATPIDFSGLKVVNADLELKTEGFAVNGVDVGPSLLTVLLQDGNLHFKSSEATLFDGKFSSDLNLNAAPSTPTMAFNFKMDGVQAKPVLSKFADFKKLSGTTEANIAVTSSGNSQKALVSGLNGNGAVVFKNGSLEGIDLVNIAKLVQKHMADMNVGEGKTDFVELGGTFVITNGVANNSDLKMKGPLVQASGSGSIDLPKKYIQYRVIPVLTASSAVEGASGISVPVDIKGPFSAIKIKPDFASVVQGIAENPEGAKKVLKNVKEQVKALRKDPAKALQNLLGGSGLLGAPDPAPQPEASPTPAPTPDSAAPVAEPAPQPAAQPEPQPSPQPAP
ncbi:MAG: AsmA family protein [Alphaproteobacteria bacterium]|nr:AsmA family protein [Alphaproteobacteria bacterium]